MADWVLIKGWHDNGQIEAVYGPYTEAQAKWLKDELLTDAMNNWTLAELRDFAEPEGPAKRDPASTTASSTQLAPGRKTPASPMGFGLAVPELDL